MEFFTSLIVYKKQLITEMEDRNIMEPEDHAFNIEAPDFESALAEVSKLIEDVCYQVAKNEAICSAFNPDFRKAIEVEGKCFGIGMTVRQVITKEFVDEIKSVKKEPDKPKLIPESLQNDIEYGINMLKSASSPDGEIAWVRNPIIVWQYYILQKHFGVPVPKELREQADRLEK